VITTVGVVAFLRLERPNQDNPVKLRQIDWLGYIVFSGSLSSFLFSLVSGGVVHPWQSAAIVTPLVIGVCGLAVFVATELFIPMRFKAVEFGVFTSRTTNIAMLDAFAFGFMFFALAFYLPVYVRTQEHNHPSGANWESSSRVFFDH